MGGTVLGAEALARTFGARIGLPRAARARLHRSRADRRRGGRARSRPHAVHRGQQVGEHAGAQHPQAALLRARSEERGRPERGRPAVHRHHRSRLEDAAPRRGRRLPRGSSSACRRIGGRFSALQRFRHGPGAPSWAWTSRGCSARPSRWRTAARRACRPTENPGARARRRHGRAAARRAATRSRSSPHRARSPWAPGSSSCWPRRSARRPRPAGGRRRAGRRPRRLRRRSAVRLPAARLGARQPTKTRRWRRWRRPGCRSSASRSPSPTSSAASSSAGSSPRRWPARCSASTRSISPTSRPPRWPPGSSPTSTSRRARWPPETPLREGDGLMLFADAAQRQRELGRERSVCRRARAPTWAGRRPGDYVALLAFLEMNPANRGRAAGPPRRASAIGCKSRPRVGFGPRYLHSTGQAYKGGAEHWRLPADHRRRRQRRAGARRRSTRFGVVKAAQARGDLQVLGERGRRAVRVHLGRDVKAGLVALRTALEQALR